MEKNSLNQQGSFDFIDRLIDLFHHTEAKPSSPVKDPKLSPLNEEFETALKTLQQIIEKRQREMKRGENPNWKRTLKVESEAARRVRQEKIQQLIRHDIEEAHARLKTGIRPHDLKVLQAFLLEASEISLRGEESHEILPRCRFSILTRLHREAGFLSLRELDDFLSQQGEAWPVVAPRDPSITPEEVQEVLKRNQAQRRKEYINYSIKKSSSLIVGIIETWKDDYPEAGSALWNSVVMEAVATALRAKWLHRFSQRLRRDRAIIESKAAELLGEKVTELNRALDGGVTSVTDAHKVVASSLRILDEIIPDLAWEHLQGTFPELKGQT